MSAITVWFAFFIAFYNEICLNKVREMDFKKHLFYVSLCFRASGPRHFINRPSQVWTCVKYVPKQSIA